MARVATRITQAMTDSYQPQHTREYRDAGDEPGVSPLAALNFLLRHRGLLLGAVIVGLAIGLIQVLNQIPSYEASVRFVASAGNSRTAASLTGEAAVVEERDPLDYYSTVVTSTDVRDAVLDTKITGGVTVRERLAADAGSSGAQAGLAAQGLGAAGVRLDSTNRTRLWNVLPVFILRVAWPDPQLASDLANAYIDALAESDRRIRSAVARSRREFIEVQIEQTSKLLKKAEDDLRLFRDQNRLLAAGGGTEGIRGTIPPQLELRREQLQREVTVQSEVYLVLKKGFEEARIAELDQAPGFVVIDRAVPPRSPSGRSRTMRVLFMGGVGLLLGLAGAGLAEVRRRADANSPEAREFSEHLAAIRQGLSRVVAWTTQPLSPPADGADPQETKHDA